MWDRKEPAPVIETIYCLAVKIYTPEDPGTVWLVPVHPCCMWPELLLPPTCGIILQPVISPAHDREGLLTTVLQKAGAQQSSLLGTTVPTRMPC